MRLSAAVACLGLVLAACADEGGAPHDHAGAEVRVTPGLPALGDAAGSGYAPGADGKLHVWFFDVGQGDAALIQSPTGKTILVDGGPAGSGARLAARLPALLDGPLDLVVVTHASEEHHGGLSRLLQTVGVRQVLLPTGPDAATPALAAERFSGLGALTAARGLPLYVAQEAQPQVLDLGGGATLTVQPVRLGHETSLALFVRHGETALLFAPDGTADTERALLAARPELRATLLKVPSHAEDGATSEALLAAVKPQVAIVSVGAGNGRGAPSRPVLARLHSAGAKVFRTDLDGELHVEGDGVRLQLGRERPAVGEPREARFTFGPAQPAVQPAVAPPPPLAVAPPEPAAPQVAVRPPPPRPKPRPRPAPAPVQAAPAAPVPARNVPAGMADAPSLRVPKGAYVASRNSDVFHVPDCRNAVRIFERNLVVYRNRKDAEKERRPAGDCNP